MTETVWIVGQLYGFLANEGWQFQGVCVTKDEAIAASRDRSYFVGPAVMGQSILHEKIEWPGLEYPLVEAP